ncbi:MAG: carbohydrate kinase family protein [Anaerolineae bacterium]|nr:carbohydrate kinase family protein [Anaerolineae bacterium]
MPVLPGHDQKVLGSLLGKQPGGMGGNVVCAASRLGLRTGLVSWIGDDVEGELVLKDLRRFGVDATHVVVEPNTQTNFTTILIDPSGEKAIIVVPTAFNTLVLDSALSIYLGQAKLVYSTVYDLDQLARVARVVHAAGGLLSADIEPVAGLQDEALGQALALLDLAFFKADISGTDYEQAAQELRALGPELVIFTLGAQGALACHAQGVVRCPAFQVPVVDTTGAGDCFTAAFLTAYLRKFPLDQALRYAQAAAALSIQGYGARGALPTDKQVHNFLNH